MKMYIQFIQNKSSFDLFSNFFQSMYKLIFLYSFPLILIKKKIISTTRMTSATLYHFIKTENVMFCKKG